MVVALAWLSGLCFGAAIYELIDWLGLFHRTELSHAITGLVLGVLFAVGAALWRAMMKRVEMRDAAEH